MASRQRESQIKPVLIDLASKNSVMRLLSGDWRLSTNIMWWVTNSFIKKGRSLMIWRLLLTNSSPLWQVIGRRCFQSSIDDSAEPPRLFGCSYERQRQFDEAFTLLLLSFEIAVFIIRQEKTKQITLLQPGCRLCMANQGRVYSNECLCWGNVGMQIRW